MHIEIAERLHPYSHLPGAYFVLPGSSLRLQIFPSLIRVDDLSGSVPKQLCVVSLNAKGPVVDFTAQQDLERGEIVVWGKSKVGYFRYKIRSNGNGFIIAMQKAPNDGIVLASEGEWSIHSDVLAKAGTSHLVGAKSAIAVESFAVPSDIERLTLGNSKAQDWSLMRRRVSLDEILPLWHRLGQMVPKLHAERASGTAELLDKCREAIAGGYPDKILAPFEALFLAGFDTGLSPRLQDTEHQGIVPQTKSIVGSPLQLLTDGAAIIRSLFIQADAKGVRILPALPPEFHCGRFLGLKCPGYGKFDIEWTKKAIRRVVFSATETRQVVFTFSQDITGCRLRTSYKDPGVKCASGVPIAITAGTVYWFDNFHG
jgi:hypothetical protein